MIRSRTNPTVKALAALKRRKGRLEQGLGLAEGLHLAQEALASCATVRQLLLAERALGRPEVESLRAAANTAEARILELSDDCFQKISDLKSPEGIAVTFALPELAPTELLKQDRARLVVLAGVQDPGNAGAVVRAAEAAGATGCLFVASVDPCSPKFIRGAQGSSFRLPCAAIGIEELLAHVRNTNLRLLAAASTAGSMPYTGADYTPPVLICLGSEGRGIPNALLQAASATVSIPMASPVESLNVAVAGGVLLYEARKAW